MAEPKLRFLKTDGTKYPSLRNATMGDFYVERNERGNESLPVLTVSIHSGVSDGELDEDELGKRVKRSTDLTLYKKAEKGDLVFNMMRAWQGAVGSVKTTGMVSPAYIVAKPNSELDPSFMDYYVQSKPVIDRFNRLSYGALDFRKRLYWDSFITAEVNIPTIEEQQKIADFLSSVDEVITTSEKEVANLKTQKKAVMKKIFSQEVRFKRADGTDFPEWDEMRIDEAVVINPRTPSIPDEFYYMDLGSVDHGQWLDKNIVMKDDAPSRAQRVADMGDVFFQSVRPYNMGHYCLDTLLDKTVVASTGFLQLRCNNMLLNRFLFQHLFEENFNKEVDLRCTGQAYPSINTESFSEIMIGIPCIEEQRLISDFLSDFDEAIAAAKKELELWKELKKGLLQQMFV